MLLLPILCPRGPECLLHQRSIRVVLFLIQTMLLHHRILGRRHSDYNKNTFRLVGVFVDCRVILTRNCNWQHLVLSLSIDTSFSIDGELREHLSCCRERKYVCAGGPFKLIPRRKCRERLSCRLIPTFSEAIAKLVPRARRSLVNQHYNQ